MYRLMIVEDDPIVRESLVFSVGWAQLGFEVVSSEADGLSALSKLETLKPDAILADIAMPFMTGLDLIRAVHTLNPETVCVLLSAYTEFEYAREAIALSVYAYLTKPLDDEELENTFRGIKKLLDKRCTQVVHHIDTPGGNAARNAARLDDRRPARAGQRRYAEPAGA